MTQATNTECVTIPAAVTLTLQMDNKS